MAKKKTSAALDILGRQALKKHSQSCPLTTVLIKIHGPKKLKNLREIGYFQMHSLNDNFQIYGMPQITHATSIKCTKKVRGLTILHRFHILSQ